ncbi:hypothetical protein MRB53_002522 [Persea americana]|uniref:Uncharacterized protein n=1 Tax=Persea americana TaxID=3435 RepID=A0ACC2MWC5_PERAE|nr:hypothetical protein MRB53_002522 [Persea americana]
MGIANTRISSSGSQRNRPERGGREGLGRHLPRLPALNATNDHRERDILQGRSLRATQLLLVPEFSLPPSDHHQGIHGNLDWGLRSQAQFT